MNFVFSLRRQAAAWPARRSAAVPVTRPFHQAPVREVGWNVSREALAGVTDPAAGSHNCLVDQLRRLCAGRLQLEPSVRRSVRRLGVHRRRCSVDRRVTRRRRPAGVFDLWNAGQGRRRLVDVGQPRATTSHTRVGPVRGIKSPPVINGATFGGGRWQRKAASVFIHTATDCLNHVASLYSMQNFW